MCSNSKTYKNNKENKPKQYTAFGITGGVGVMIGIFFAFFLRRIGLLIPHIPNFVEQLKRFFGG